MSSLVFVTIHFKSQFRESSRKYSIHVNYQEKENIADEVHTALEKAFMEGKKVTVDLTKYNLKDSFRDKFSIDMSEVKDFSVRYTTN